ncbi:MAG TPA: hypothetical protein DCY13_14980 [Verrucomicrobiales bacterium]|nr:hypothetical protein [Verrucomicrobiales bacterium]
MKLPADTIILRRKVTEYLLRHRAEDDKSAFLALAGYTADHADQLLLDLREQLLPLDAELFEESEYGPKYGIRGTLTGPNGRALRVLSIWMKDHATGETKFVTLRPDKA